MFYLKANPARKSAEGAPIRVFDPERHDFLPESGRYVSECVYWVRLLAKGDAVLCDAPKRVLPRQAKSSNKHDEASTKAQTNKTKATKLKAANQSL